MPFNANEYKQQFAKEKYKRIPLDVAKEDYEKIKAYADNNGETVNGFIKRLISEAIEKDNNKSSKSIE